MANVILRMATENDAGRMASVYAPYVECSTASWEERIPGRAEMASRLQEHLDAGFPWLVAQEDDAILGYAYAGRFGERPGFDWDTEVSIYLSEDTHRRHVGSALYTALLAILKQQGYCNVYALVTHPNPASEAFHKSMGFYEAARLPGAGHKLGQWLGLSYFYLSLCPLPEQPVRPVPLRMLDSAFVRQCLLQAQQTIRPF